jgi:uncharacterized protein YccT (UPF0319 family)
MKTILCFKTNSLFLLALFVLMSFNGHAASEIIIPEHFDIVQVNDKPYSQGMFEQNKKFLVEPGIHKFILRYSDVIDLADGDFEKVLSRDIIVVFETEDGFRYTLTSKRPSQLEQAREFANNPIYNIEKEPLLGDGRGKVIVSDSENLQKLKHLWLQATDQDKENFKAWISEAKDEQQ